MRYLPASLCRPRPVLSLLAASFLALPLAANPLPPPQERKEEKEAPKPLPASTDARVVPFDAAKVRHWPGLPNQGAACFINASFKLLASVPALDPILADTPGDDVPTANLRRQLRRVINFIRSADAPGQPPAKEVVAGFFDALAKHERTVTTFKRAEAYGGQPSDFIDLMLSVLGKPDAFAISTTVRTTSTDPAATDTYDDSVPLRLNLAAGPGGQDLAPVPTLADFLALVLTVPNSWTVGAHTTHVHTYPTLVPATAFLDVNRVPGPGKPVAFSATVHIPTFTVDKAHGTATPRDRATLHCTALGMDSDCHSWAVVRGNDGWYIQDDELPPRPATPAEMDDYEDPGEEKSRRVGFVVYHK
jgi:hypothetical protein